MAIENLDLKLENPYLYRQQIIPPVHALLPGYWAPTGYGTMAYNAQPSGANLTEKKKWEEGLAQNGGSSVTNQLTAAGIDAVSSQLSGLVTDGMFGDSGLGRGIGTVVSQGVSSAGNTMANNILKGTSLTQGLGQNVGASVAGAAAGLGANYIGKGINALGGNSMLSRGIGQGVATGLGALGGTAL